MSPSEAAFRREVVMEASEGKCKFESENAELQIECDGPEDQGGDAALYLAPASAQSPAQNCATQWAAS
jgi:hypothetical protein